jgi:APA family basic amino acid/polyamine antiporter
VIVCVLVLTVDVRGAIGFSSFGVLLYYLIANIAALTQPAEQRRYPRWLQLVGAAGCLLLVAALPWPAIVTGMAVFAAGVGYRAARLAISRSSQEP